MTSASRETYLKKLLDRRGNGMIKVITGIRRSGKSFLLTNLYRDYLLNEGVDEDEIISIDLEDEANSKYRDPDVLYSYCLDLTRDRDKSYFLFIDEAQLAIKKEELQLEEPIKLYGVLSGLAKRNVDVYVTGSNSRFLSSEVRTEFRDRGDEVKVYPLSFSEFFKAHGGEKDLALAEYMAYGGMPFLLSCQSEEQKASYLKGLFARLYLKDIVERHNLRNEVHLEEVLDAISSSISSLTNPHKLSNTFSSKGVKIDDKTIASYLSFFEESFLIEKAVRYDVKGKYYLDSPFKFYYEDLGLRNARLNFREMDEPHLLENLIYLELLKRGYSVDVGVVPFREKNKAGALQQKNGEVDFVCNKASRRIYVQTSWALPSQEKKEQEEKSLLKIGDNFKKVIVSKDIIKTHYDSQGTIMMNLFDFLLDDESLEKA